MPLRGDSPIAAEHHSTCLHLDTRRDIFQIAMQKVKSRPLGSLTLGYGSVGQAISSRASCRRDPVSEMVGSEGNHSSVILRLAAF